MASESRIKRPPFAVASRSKNERPGKTDAAQTPVQIKSGGHKLDETLREWIHERMGRQLGKYASQIERVMVRFGDENGPKGGLDKVCLIQVTLSSLPPVVAQELGQTEREAFDRAMSKAERSARHNIQRHGFTSKGAPKGFMVGPREEEEEPETTALGEGAGETEAVGDPNEQMIGKRTGHTRQQLLEVQRYTEKVDTTKRGVSAADKRVGNGHTAARNIKLNTAGMSYSLEDSATARPSRKSTRRATNRIKPDAQLTRRTKSGVHSPQARSRRASP